MPTFLKDNAAATPVRIVGNNPTVSTKSVAPLRSVDNKSIPFLIVSESITLNQNSWAWFCN